MHGLPNKKNYFDTNKTGVKINKKQEKIKYFPPVLLYLFLFSLFQKHRIELLEQVI